MYNQATRFAHMLKPMQEQLIEVFKTVGQVVGFR